MVELDFRTSVGGVVVVTLELSTVSSDGFVVWGKKSAYTPLQSGFTYEKANWLTLTILALRFALFISTPLETEAVRWDSPPR
jgi:hypothetical protein